VKEFLKQVNICHIFDRNFEAYFLCGHCIGVHCGSTT